MGKLGFLTPKKRPLMPHLAQCAISKAQKGSNSFQEEHCKGSKLVLAHCPISC